MSRSLADNDSFERQHLDADTVELVFARSLQLLLERVESCGRQHEIDAVESLATDGGRLEAKTWCIHPTGLARRFTEPLRIDPADPQIEILGGAGRPLNESRPHSHNQVRHAQRIERLQQRPFSRSEDDIEHGSDRDAVVLQVGGRATSGHGRHRLGRAGFAVTMAYASRQSASLRTSHAR